MRTHCIRPGLPKAFRRHADGRDIIFEKDLRIGTSRLRCKLLVFDNRKDLRRFWREALGKRRRVSDLGRYCDGAVHALWTERIDYAGETEIRRTMEVDPRYFAIMGILKRRLASAEVNAHEAVHAGFAYAKRIKRTPWDDQILHFEEEAVAYPAGKIARELADVFWKHFDNK